LLAPQRGLIATGKKQEQLRRHEARSTMSFALISIATFGHTGSLANLLAIPADVFPKGAVASVWGFASMESGFGGMIFSLVTGWMVDRYSSPPAFVLFGIILLVPAASVWTLPKNSGA
jgi:MFS transporter, ACS family, hexuronate transporter